MSQENKTIVRNYIEQVWNAHRVESLEKFVAKNVVDHNASGDLDYDGVKSIVAAILKAFPDFKVTIDDVIAEGDRVVLRETISGTLQGELLGMPATGKHGTWTGIGVLHLAGGKITEIWSLNDQQSMMQQLGLIPQPAQPAS